MTASKLVPVIVALLATPFAWALPAPGLLDDAGSGADAGATPAGAMALSYGRYQGNLTPDDADWFAFPAPLAPSCATLRVESKHAMRVGYGAASSPLVGTLSATGLFDVTLAQSPSTLLLGALPDEQPWNAVSVGPYAFQAATAAPGLAGDEKLRDAPSTLAGAVHAPGRCFSGFFKSDGIDTDVFRFNASARDVVTVSMGALGNRGQVELLAANGTVLAGPAPAGSAVQALANETGTYFLRATAVDGSTDATYTLAFSLGPDPSGPGCRPYCLT